jgi:hypothetical protein
VFQADYTDKLTGLEEDSNAATFIEGGHRSRRTFREHAKPGAICRILLGKHEATYEDYLFSVNDMAIGMLQTLGLQVSVRSGITLALSWPRKGGYFVQEVWTVENIQPTLLSVPRPAPQATKVLKGIQFTLVADLNADSIVDKDLLEASDA